MYDLFHHAAARGECHPGQPIANRLPFEIGLMTSRTIILVQPFPLGEIEGLLRRERLSLPCRNSPNTGGATQSEDHQPTEDHSFLHHVTFSQVIIPDAAWLSIWHSNR